MFSGPQEPTGSRDLMGRNEGIFDAEPRQRGFGQTIEKADEQGPEFIFVRRRQHG
jgi:hypothetical protein